MCSVFWPNFSVKFLVDRPARRSFAYLSWVLSCCVLPVVLRCVVLRCVRVSVVFLSFPRCVALCCVAICCVYRSCLFPVVLRCVVLRFATVSAWDFSTIIYLRSTTGRNNSTDRQWLHQRDQLDQLDQLDQRHNIKHVFHRVFSESKHLIFLFSFRNADCIINLSLFVGSDYPPSLTKLPLTYSSPVMNPLTYSSPVMNQLASPWCYKNLTGQTRLLLVKIDKTLTFKALP